MNDLHRNTATHEVLQRKLTLKNVAYRVSDVTQLKATKGRISSGAQNPHGHLHAKSAVDPGSGSTLGVIYNTEATSDPPDRPPRDPSVMGAPQPMSFFRGRAKGKRQALLFFVSVASNALYYTAVPFHPRRSAFRSTQSSLFRSPSGAQAGRRPS